MTKIIFPVVLLLIAMVAILVISKKYNKKTSSYSFINSRNVDNGNDGENKVAKLLDYVKTAKDCKVINNVLLNSDSSKSAQIDHIVIGNSGIYLIETKNFNGSVYITKDGKWYQSPTYTGEAVEFYSPEKQGLYHLYILAQAIGLKTKKYCHVITVFPDDVIVENHSSAKVLHYKDLPKELCSHYGNFLTDEIVEKIYERISSANQFNKKNLNKHIKRVHKLYH